jgi:hypothetical protein
MQPTARGPGQHDPLSQPPHPLRTAVEIGADRGWQPPPRTSGPLFSPGQPTLQPAPQPTSEPTQQPTRSPEDGLRGALTNVGNQFAQPRVRQALLAGLEGYERARYYRQAGLAVAAGDVLRQRLGAPTSYQIRQRRGITGLDPGYLEVTRLQTGW